MIDSVGYMPLVETGVQLDCRPSSGESVAGEKNSSGRIIAERLTQLIEEWLCDGSVVRGFEISFCKFSPCTAKVQ